MHIGMAVYAGGFRFREYKAFMALPAIDHLVLACQGHECFIMIESVNRLIEGPSFRTMTKITVELKIFAMRRIRH